MTVNVIGSSTNSHTYTQSATTSVVVTDTVNADSNGKIFFTLQRLLFGLSYRHRQSIFCQIISRRPVYLRVFPRGKMKLYYVVKLNRNQA